MDRSRAITLAVLGVGAWLVWTNYRQADYGVATQNTEDSNVVLGFVKTSMGAMMSGGVNDQMSPSIELLAFLKDYENPEKKGRIGGRWYVHDDGYGYKTIGYGHKVLIGEDFSNGLTDAEVERLFSLDAVEHALPIYNLVQVPLTQNQFDALLSLIYNIGGTRFAGSAILKLLNDGDYDGAGNHLMDWVKARNKKTGKMEYSTGLYNRRVAEHGMWFHGRYLKFYNGSWVVG